MKPRPMWHPLTVQFGLPGYWETSMRTLFVLTALCLSGLALGQDYEREQRWADQILPSLMVGDAIWLEQKEGH